MFIKYSDLPDAVREKWQSRAGAGKATGRDWRILQAVVFGEGDLREAVAAHATKIPEITRDISYESIGEAAEVAALELYQRYDNASMNKGAGRGGTHQSLYTYALENLMEKMWAENGKRDEEFKVYFGVATAILMPIVEAKIKDRDLSLGDVMYREPTGIIQHLKEWVDDRKKFESLKKTCSNNSSIIFLNCINHSITYKKIEENKTDLSLGRDWRENMLRESLREFSEKKELWDQYKILEGALKELDPRLREVLNMRFGFEKEMTLEEIGGTMGITSERVRQLESAALKKLQGYFKDEEKGR